MQNAECKISERLRVDYIASRRTTKQIFAKPYFKSPTQFRNLPLPISNLQLNIIGLPLNS